MKNEIIYGGEGRDVIDGNGGNDIIYGGIGNFKTIQFSSLPNFYFINISMKT